MIKRIFYFLFCHGLYDIGYLFSRCMYRGWLYPIYSWYMVKSCVMDDTHDLRIWDVDFWQRYRRVDAGVMKHFRQTKIALNDGPI